MKFSQRIGKTKIRTIIQKESIDDVLMNKIWNVFYKKIIYNFINNEFLSDLLKIYWEDFSNKRIDEFPGTDYALNDLKIWFFKSKWYEVYDFIEFSAKIENNYNLEYQDKLEFIFNCNLVLKEELSAFRVIDYQIVPISDDIEIESIEEAIDTSGKFSNVTTHLSSAIEFLSDRENPNYRNSIKESISAIETICRIITGEHTLGKALKKLENSGVHINKQLKNAFEKLYLYSNDKETGIRHALIEAGYTPTFDEAKFMLVSCSAFINYLKSKNI